MVQQQHLERLERQRLSDNGSIIKVAKSLRDGSLLRYPIDSNNSSAINDMSPIHPSQHGHGYQDGDRDRGRGRNLLDESQISRSYESGLAMSPSRALRFYPPSVIGDVKGKGRREGRGRGDKAAEDDSSINLTFTGIDGIASGRSWGGSMNDSSTDDDDCDSQVQDAPAPSSPLRSPETTTGRDIIDAYWRVGVLTERMRSARKTGIFAKTS